MKKIIVTISLIFFSLISTTNLVFAGEPGNCDDKTSCKSGYVCVQIYTKTDPQGNPLGNWGTCKSPVDALTQRPDNASSDTKYVQKLPSITLESGISVTIKAILKLIFGSVIIAIVVAAFYYMLSRGKEEDTTKAKDIIIYLIVGLVIVGVAYGIVAGITQFNVFG